MRVLDPAVRNPVYKLHHKATEKVGDVGTLATITGAGIMVPVGAGVIFDSIYALIATLGWYGLITFRGYKKNTKNKTRLTVMMKLREEIEPEDRHVVDRMMKEVYDCPAEHYDFRLGSPGIRYYAEINRSESGYSFASRSEQFRETTEEWNKRRKVEQILLAGHGCRYCGDRIVATQLLRDQTVTAKPEDNSSVEAALLIIEAKREANESYKEFSSIYTDAQKELM